MELSFAFIIRILITLCYYIITASNKVNNKIQHPFHVKEPISLWIFNIGEWKKPRLKNFHIFFWRLSNPLTQKSAFGKWSLQSRLLNEELFQIMFHFLTHPPPSFHKTLLSCFCLFSLKSEFCNDLERVNFSTVGVTSHDLNIFSLEFCFSDVYFCGVKISIIPYLPF